MPVLVPAVVPLMPAGHIRRTDRDRQPARAPHRRPSPSRAAASMLGSELDVTQTRQSSASSDSATAGRASAGGGGQGALAPQAQPHDPMLEPCRARCRRSRRFATLAFAAIGLNTPSCSSQVQQLHLGPPAFIAAPCPSGSTGRGRPRGRRFVTTCLLVRDRSEIGSHPLTPGSPRDSSDVRSP
jgi:hypothetical protein